MKISFLKQNVGLSWLALCIGCLFAISPVQASALTEPQKAGQQYYEWRVYHFKSEDQKKVVEEYLQKAAIPALNKLGISPIGVFDEPDAKDGPKLHVLIPYNSLDQFEQTPAKLTADVTYQKAAAAYLNTAHTEPAYDRIESSLMKAFKDMPTLKVPKTSVPKRDRVYEFRSYESFSEKSGLKKIHMFNEGGEIKLFDRLGFNAVFFAQTIAGTRMPNLTYMTTFDNKESRDKHWEDFSNDLEWKKLSGKEEYANTVSKADILFLIPTDYSQI